MCVPIPLTVHKVNYLLKSSREEADWINKQLCTLTEEFAAKSLQSCPTLCDPIDGSLPGSSVHGIFQARVLEWGAIVFSEWRPSVAKNYINFLKNVYSVKAASKRRYRLETKAWLWGRWGSIDRSESLKTWVLIQSLSTSTLSSFLQNVYIAL